MHCLITGGAGMIGSQLARRLAGMGADVSIVDNLWRGRREYLLDPGGRAVIDLESNLHVRDLALPGALDDLLHGVDHVFHLADVVAGIGYVFGNERWLFRQNLLINTNVVDSVARCGRGIESYTYVGTACSFPQGKQTGVDAAPLVEADLYPADPESAYGWSKLMGQYEADLLAKCTEIRVETLIFHNVYGAPCDISRERSQVLPALARRAAEWPREPFVVWGSGSQGRAFVHVSDVVDALVLALEKGTGERPLQIGPDHCTSIREAAEAVVKASGKPIELLFDPTRPEGDRGRRANYSRARAVLGWEPKVAFADGIAELYDFVDRALAREMA